MWTERISVTKLQPGDVYRIYPDGRWWCVVHVKQRLNLSSRHADLVLVKVLGDTLTRYYHAHMTVEVQRGDDKQAGDSAGAR